MALARSDGAKGGEPPTRDRGGRGRGAEQEAVDEGLGGEGECSDDDTLLAVSSSERHVAVGHGLEEDPIVADDLSASPEYASKGMLAVHSHGRPPSLAQSPFPTIRLRTAVPEGNARGKARP